MDVSRGFQKSNMLKFCLLLHGLLADLRTWPPVVICIFRQLEANCPPGAKTGAVSTTQYIPVKSVQ